MFKLVDRSGRRDRFAVHPRGKRLVVTPDDLLLFQKLDQHGPLTARYLHEFLNGKRSWPAYTRNRMSDFSHEPYGDKSQILCKPEAQKRALSPNLYGNDLLYALTEDGRKLLAEHAMALRHPAASGGVPEHQFMTASITASIELAALSNPNVRYLSADELLAEGAEIGTTFALTNPYTNKTEDRALIPDALFGLEYRDRRRLFFVEADRATEPIYAKDFKRKSWIKSYLQYLEFVGRRRYRNHYGISDAKAAVLVVTTSPTQKYNIMSMLLEQSKGRGCTFMLFQTAEEFNPFVRPPGVLRRLFNDPWQRAGQPSLLINS